MEKFSWRKRGKSFVYAFNGIRMFVLNEHNAWIHCTVAVCVIIAGFVFGVSVTEWCLIALCIGMVLAAEAVNTAVENIVDLVSPEYNALAGKAKDIAAGAVLVTAISAAVVGCIIFVPKLLLLFGLTLG